MLPSCVMTMALYKLKDKIRRDKDYITLQWTTIGYVRLDLLSLDWTELDWIILSLAIVNNRNYWHG